MTSRPPQSILIVEDERIVAKDIQQTLRELGYEAYAIASSAEEAIARASERCPDLVLMDIRIKGQRDGIETAKILKAKFAVPVVYLTAHADETTLGRATKTEPHGYLLKPVKTAELRSMVEVSLYRHEMERRRREREQVFSTALQSIADAVIAVDLSGSVTFMNATAEALTGVLSATASGKPIREVLRLVDEQVSAEQPALTALREGRAVEPQEARLLNLSSGALRLINDSATPVLDDTATQTLGAVMVFRDVTEQKKLQKQLELADRLASLGTMAAGVAHEVNNPLAVVVANARFLSDELELLRAQLESAPPSSDAAKQRIDELARAVTDVQSAAGRIGRIVADLRGFTRPVPETNGAVNVLRCVEWALRTTAHEFHHRARIVTHLGFVPRVNADEARLGQVFINLLVNAAQAIVPGNADRNEVTIGAHMDKNGRAVVEVRDTGVGISKDVLKRIFEPFFTTKAVEVGTGLGLSICQGIVNSLGGEMSVESELGQGTTVRVSLPAAVSQRVTVPVPIAKRSNPRRGRILVIDDEELVLRALKRVLRDHELCCLASAQEALALIDQGRWFDLILCDLMMPNMTGIKFYENLLSEKPELARRVVFLTGGAISAQVDDFLRSVSNLRIEKPFDVGSLHETVQQLLAEQSDEPTPASVP